MDLVELRRPAALPFLLGRDELGRQATAANAPANNQEPDQDADQPEVEARSGDFGRCLALRLAVLHAPEAGGCLRLRIAAEDRRGLGQAVLGALRGPFLRVNRDALPGGGA